MQQNAAFFRTLFQRSSYAYTYTTGRRLLSLGKELKENYGTTTTIEWIMSCILYEHDDLMQYGGLPIQIQQ